MRRILGEHLNRRREGNESERLALCVSGYELSSLLGLKSERCSVWAVH